MWREVIRVLLKYCIYCASTPSLHIGSTYPLMHDVVGAIVLYTPMCALFRVNSHQKCQAENVSMIYRMVVLVVIHCLTTVSLSQNVFFLTAISPKLISTVFTHKLTHQGSTCEADSLQAKSSLVHEYNG